MTPSQSKRKDSSKKSSLKYYQKYVFAQFTGSSVHPLQRNKKQEDEKACERMKKLRAQRSISLLHVWSDPL